MESFGQFEAAILILMIVLWIVPIGAAVLVILLLDMGKHDKGVASTTDAILPPRDSLAHPPETKPVSSAGEAEPPERKRPRIDGEY